MNARRLIAFPKGSGQAHSCLLLPGRAVTPAYRKNPGQHSNCDDRERDLKPDVPAN